MTLDREAARALFANAEPMPQPAAAAGVYTPAAADESPFGHDGGVFERMQGRKARKGVDWRLVAPLGVAAVCIGAVALFAIPGNSPTEEGKTVASTEIVAPPVAAPPPAEPVTTAVAPPPAAPVAAPAPAPVVQRAAAPRPAQARRAPARQVAAAPSASDSASNVSARERVVAPPTLGAPAAVTLTPANPAPVAPPPVVQPTPSTPVEPQ